MQVKLNISEGKSFMHHMHYLYIFYLWFFTKYINFTLGVVHIIRNALGERGVSYLLRSFLKIKGFVRFFCYEGGGVKNLGKSRYVLYG
jgi:hypothetical protein